MKYKTVVKRKLGRNLYMNEFERQNDAETEGKCILQKKADMKI